MRQFHSLTWLGILGVVAAAALTSSAQEAGTTPIDGKVVKYAGLAEVVLQNRGKVVVVDIWHVNCPPCLEGMGHLIALQKKYGKDGLVAVTVDLDAAFGRQPLPKIQMSVRECLTKFGSPVLLNLILDEPRETIDEKLHIDSYPTVYVFSREGRWHRFRNEFTHEDVEKLVVKLLSAK